MSASPGEVTLRVGGKTYILALKMAGLMALQKRLSPAGSVKRLDVLLPELERAIKEQSLEHLVVFIWAAMQKHQPGTSEADAMNLIDDAGGLVGLEAAFRELKDSVMPDADDMKELAPAGGGEGRPRKAQAKR